jgi:1-phosphofructokinase
LTAEDSRSVIDAGGGDARVTIFGPDPLLSVTLERRGETDDIHLHAAGQGVWVARMAGELGAHPVLCCLSGGETGSSLEALLARLPGERRTVATTGSSGSYVTDRRDGERRVLAIANRPPPCRHEVDDLVAMTTVAALSSAVLVLCNPFPPGDLPGEAFATVAGNAAAAGIPLVVDLSSPRLESTLAARPAVVKLNDWELAEYVGGRVDGPRAPAAMHRLRDAGAQTVVLTRGGEPVLVLGGDDDAPYEIVPPRFTHGFREGCGDAMTGAIAAGLATGLPLPDALVLGVAAGAGNFLRHGLGSGRRAVVHELCAQVTVRPAETTSPAPARTAG